MEKTFNNSTERQYVAPEMEEIIIVFDSNVLTVNTSGSSAGDFDEEEG